MKSTATLRAEFIQWHESFHAVARRCEAGVRAGAKDATVEYERFITNPLPSEASMAAFQELRGANTLSEWVDRAMTRMQEVETVRLAYGR